MQWILQKVNEACFECSLENANLTSCNDGQYKTITFGPPIWARRSKFDLLAQIGGPGRKNVQKHQYLSSNFNWSHQAGVDCGECLVFSAGRVVIWDHTLQSTGVNTHSTYNPRGECWHYYCVSYRKELYVMKVWILDAMPLYTSYTVSFSSSYALIVFDIILILQWTGWEATMQHSAWLPKENNWWQIFQVHYSKPLHSFEAFQQSKEMGPFNSI